MNGRKQNEWKQANLHFCAGPGLENSPNPKEVCVCVH